MFHSTPEHDFNQLREQLKALQDDLAGVPFIRQATAGEFIRRLVSMESSRRVGFGEIQIIGHQDRYAMHLSLYSVSAFLAPSANTHC